MSKYLEVVGATTHNLKNISVKIPKNKMTVITGVSGSGKSSLAFNTIYNVGQQKYLESLSSYARMFIGGMEEEAEVNEIHGLSPTISIDQKTTNRNPRSTVGTITEIYDYYKALYLNVGVRKCIQCGTVVKKDSLQDIIDYISKKEVGEKFMIEAPLDKDFSDFAAVKEEILDLGFIRFSIDGQVYTVNDEQSIKNIKNVYIVVDRLVVKEYEEDSSDEKRLKDSLALAYKLSDGLLRLNFFTETKDFSQVFICSSCGHIPETLSISSFSFNNHSGACQTCHGLGVKKVFLEERVINPNLTLLEGAVIAPGFGGDYFYELISAVGKKHKIELNKKYKLLSDREKKLVLHGTGKTKYDISFTNDYGKKNHYKTVFEGVLNTLSRRYFDGGAEKGLYDSYVVDVDCPDCNGYRLNEESLSVYIAGKNIGEVSDMSVSDSLVFFKSLKLSASEGKIAKKALKNIVERLEFLAGVGLDYMTISRKSGTLSGGESQRIRLATQLGTKLEGIIYVLDEPSIGLHPRDNDMLIANLKKLRDIGNTLLIVEHDEDIMRESDHIIDIGPGAGVHGGTIVAEGTVEEIINNPKSVTAPYLSGEKKIEIERKARPSFTAQKKAKKVLSVYGAAEHNLKNIDVTIPLENFVVVTGVSGSGKSSLVNDILANYLANELNRAKRQVGAFDKITGLENLDKTVIIDQSPIGRTPRSNPATYTGVFTPIREIFSMTEEAQIRGYAPGRFSFNTKSGRCPDCDGDGVKKIEMHFLPPVYIECETCCGKRYNPETLKIKYRGQTIADVLDMTVEEANIFFKNHPKVTKILKVLEQVGLGYIKLGQSSTTLSGGESQRVKLATELSKRATTKTFYILDEPTTGLHFQDVQKLLKILHTLVDKGNTVLIIEHNMDVILNADHLIDIGPVGGDKGGTVVYEGDLAGIKKCKKSVTGSSINKYLH